MGWFFNKYDVLLTPTLGRLPAELGVYEPAEPIDLRDVFSVWSPLESFLPMFNASGQPAISLPLHQSAVRTTDRYATRRRVRLRVAVASAVCTT